MPQLTIAETGQPSRDPGLALVGELDLAVADQLADRVRFLGRAGTTIRLDLSGLEFVDLVGLRAIIACVSYAYDNGFELRIEQRVSAAVHRLIDLVGAKSQLWPER